MSCEKEYRYDLIYGNAAALIVRCCLKSTVRILHMQTVWQRSRRGQSRAAR